jgi:diamine N-acetyltransferase
MIFRLDPCKDFATIQHLAQQIWQDHYVPMIGQKQVDYMLSRFCSVKALKE